MSNGSALAACTAVLLRLFQESLPGATLAGALGANPAVTALPPDRVTIGTNEAPQLNLFLYRVAPNTGWSNRELPSHDRGDGRTTQAPLALDLHYVVSAYGSGNLHADLLLGHAALVLHTVRHLTRARIRQLSTAASIPVALRTVLAASGLDDQEEVVRLTPENLGIDDIAKLWSVLGERYRTSVAFSASVLLLRPDAPARVPKPVRASNLRVVPVPLARIERVEPPMVSVGDQLVISGHGLRTPATVVRFGGEVDVPLPAGSTSQRVEVTVPDGVRSGVSGVQVIHEVDFGPESGPRHAADSNIGPFTVRPLLALDANGDPDLTVADVQVVGGVLEAGTVTARLSPAVERRQRVRLVLDRLGAGPRRQYALVAPARHLEAQPTTDAVTVDVTGVEAGTYLAAVEVDGVATAFTVDATGAFDGPTVELQ